jgi:hypothetical protein
LLMIIDRIVEVIDLSSVKCCYPIFILKITRLQRS